MTEGSIYVREKKGSLDLSWTGVRGGGILENVPSPGEKTHWCPFSYNSFFC